jgi:F-type H+-transporting ATPase subunit b
MRKFRLLLAAVVALFALVGFAPHAWAQEGGGDETNEVAEEETEISHSAEECIHLLEEGEEIDACQEAPNPILPETNEIIWGTIGFAAVFAFVYWKGLPAIKGGMNARTERIRNDLESAESLKAEADGVLADYRAQLAEAKTESSRIIEEARQQAEAMKRELAARADAEIAEMRQKTAADIEAAKVQAIADLRGEVTALAIGAAEQVIERNLDDAANRELVESYINRVGAAR